MKISMAIIKCQTTGQSSGSKFTGLKHWSDIGKKLSVKYLMSQKEIYQVIDMVKIRNYVQFDAYAIFNRLK